MDPQEGTQEPKLILAHKIFLLRHPDVPDIEKIELKNEVFNLIKAEDMANLYESLCGELGWDIDQDLLQTMRVKIEEELKKLDEKVSDAEENLGESEVREAHLAKSLYYIRIGDKEKALEQIKITEGKTVAVGQKPEPATGPR